MVWINTTATLFHRERSAVGLKCYLLQTRGVNYALFIAVVVLPVQWTNEKNVFCFINNGLILSGKKKKKEILKADHFSSFAFKKSITE